MTQVEMDDLPMAWRSAASAIAADRFEHYAAAGLTEGEPSSDDERATAIEKLAHGGLLDEQDTLRWRTLICEFFGLGIEAWPDRRTA